MKALRTEAHRDSPNPPTDGGYGGRAGAATVDAVATPVVGSGGTGAGALAGPAVAYVDIDENSAGQRLDNLLIRLCKGVPKSHVYQLIRSGQVRLNGKRCSADSRVELGDRLRLPPIRVAAPAAAEYPAPAVEFPVIFENEGLIVINKPAGVAVHGGSGVSSGVIEQLRSARPQAKFLELVHRLDRDTSGVLLVAKKRATLTELQRQLRERQTDKRYLAIVHGRWPLRSKRLDSPLHKYLTAEGERRVVVQADGQHAITTVTGLSHVTLASAGLCSLVECHIETGRTHQIRVHLSHAGFPLLGDDKYGQFELNKLLHKSGYKRMYLHAFSIEIREPISGRKTRFESPMPASFDQLMAAGVTAAGVPTSTGPAKAAARASNAAAQAASAAAQASGDTAFASGATSSGATSDLPGGATHFSSRPPARGASASGESMPGPTRRPVRLVVDAAAGRGATGTARRSGKKPAGRT